VLYTFAKWIEIFLHYNFGDDDDDDDENDDGKRELS
jgi:hypothetical protein